MTYCKGNIGAALAWATEAVHMEAKLFVSVPNFEDCTTTTGCGPFLDLAQVLVPAVNLDFLQQNSYGTVVNKPMLHSLPTKTLTGTRVAVGNFLRKTVRIAT